MSGPHYINLASSFLFHHLLDVHPDPGPGAVVEDDDEVGAHAGEYPHLQLVEEPDKEAHKAGKQVNLCIKTYRSMMRREMHKKYRQDS